MLSDRNQLADLIPHGNSMSVIDQVLSYDENFLIATTTAHGKSKHPLFKRDGSTILLVEYAAQAAAIHAALNKAKFGAQRPAYLGALKNISMPIKTLTNVASVLSINVQCVFSETNGAIYFFHITSESVLVIEGRLVLAQP